LNSDASRIGYQHDEKVQTFWNNRGGSTINASEGVGTKPKTGEDAYDPTRGRWPANLILDEEAAAALDEQSIAGGIHSPGKARKGKVIPTRSFGVAGSGNVVDRENGNRFDDGETIGASRFFYVAKAPKRERGEGNNHPTVKPVKLMEYLIRLVTPPGGTCLDPFMGSGTTGVAAKNLGFEFIGIEREAEYIEIAERRIEATV